MRLLVVGAHHGVGACVVRFARECGHEVTTFEADVLDAQAVVRSVAGQDAVISTLGPRKGSPADLCARGTRNLIAAMKAQHVQRLVQITGAVIGHPRDRLGLVYRLIRALLPQAMLADRQIQEELVKNSGLEWTVIRPTRLTDRPGRGTFRSDEHEWVGAFAEISREDVAVALVRAVEEPATVGRSLTLQRGSQ